MTKEYISFDELFPENIDKRNLAEIYNSLL